MDPLSLLCSVQILSFPHIKPDPASPPHTRILTSMRNAGYKPHFPFQRIKHSSSWLHLMQIQIFICELNCFSALHTKLFIFLNKDMTFIALVDAGPQPQSTTDLQPWAFP